MEFENLHNQHEEDEDLTDYAEVLSLSSYDGVSEISNSNNEWGVVAQYNQISVTETTKKSKFLAKDFVAKVSKMLAKVDENQTPEMTSYLKIVADVNVNKIADLAFLVDSNRQLIENVLHRINSTNGEDFVTFNLHSQLVTTQLKLQKELYASFNDLPAVFKRAKAEVLTEEQNLKIDGINDVLVDNDSNQFRTQKDLILALRAEKEMMNNKTLNT